jgi:hypothetical protein
MAAVKKPAHEPAGPAREAGDPRGLRLHRGMSISAGGPGCASA